MVSSAVRVRRALPDAFTAVLFCSTAALFSVSSVLLAHTLVLGLLTAAHVVLALRYLRGWLAPAAPPALLRVGMLGVALMGGLRLAVHQGALGQPAAATIEIGLLIAILVPALPVALPGAGLLGAAMTGSLAALALATLRAPVDARVLAEWAVLVVPMLLLIMRLPPGRRRGLLSAGLLFFGAVPLLIAGGVPATLAGELGLLFPDHSPAALGPLEAHLTRVFPTGFHAHPRAADFFRARTYLDIVHCAVVLAVLPVLPRHPDAPAALSTGALVVLVATLTGAALAGLALAPVDTHGLLSAAAALEGWLELPLVAVAVGAPVLSARPTAPRSG